MAYEADETDDAKCSACVKGFKEHDRGGCFDDMGQGVWGPHCIQCHNQLPSKHALLHCLSTASDGFRPDGAAAPTQKVALGDICKACVDALPTASADCVLCQKGSS